MMAEEEEDDDWSPMLGMKMKEFPLFLTSSGSWFGEKNEYDWPPFGRPDRPLFCPTFGGKKEDNWSPLCRTG
jgi:hypothetical protein